MEIKIDFDEKHKEELSKYANKIIKLLNNLNVGEKYVVIKNLYFSFMDTCKEENIKFIEEDSQE